MSVLGRFTWALLGIALALVPSTATVAASGEAAPRSFEEMILDPAWQSRFVSSFKGWFYITNNFDQTFRRYAVTSILNKTAKGCGFSYDEKNGAIGPNRIVIVYPSSINPAEDVADQVSTVFQHLPTPVLPGQSQAAIVSDASAQLASRGYSVSDIALEGSVSARLVLLDSVAFAGPDHNAVAEFGYFIGITGAPAPGQPFDSKYSYFFGSGNLADAAGSKDNDLPKFCAAMGITALMCGDRPVGGLTKADVDRALSHIDKSCDPSSPLMNKLTVLK